MESYFVVSVNGDGDVRVTESTQETLEAELNKPREAGFRSHVLETIPDSDPGYWQFPDDCCHALLIIKGEIVVPRACETVTRWEL